MCPGKPVNIFFCYLVRQRATWGRYETCTPVLDDGGVASRPVQLCSRDHSTSPPVPYPFCPVSLPGPSLPPLTLYVSLFFHMVSIFSSCLAIRTAVGHAWWPFLAAFLLPLWLPHKPCPVLGSSLLASRQASIGNSLVSWDSTWSGLHPFSNDALGSLTSLPACTMHMHPSPCT